MSSMNNGAGGPPEDDLPIRPLAELEQDVSADFLRSVRKKIYRRTATGQVLSFSWNLPRVIFMELISLISGLLESGTNKVKP